MAFPLYLRPHFRHFRLEMVTPNFYNGTNFKVLYQTGLNLTLHSNYSYKNWVLPILRPFAEFPDHFRNFRSEMVTATF